jgi:hypothetical protein
MAHRFNTGDRLEAVRHRSVGVDLPLPLHERIDELCQVVYDATYDRPPIRKMLAALVLAAPADASKLQQLLDTYQRACVSDSLVLTRSADGIVEFPDRKSGPRRSRPQQDLASDERDRG